MKENADIFDFTLTDDEIHAGGQMSTSGLPNATVRVLSDIGHEPFIEAPEETIALLHEFLAG